MAGKGFIGEFKEFIAKGNVMDMAVGVVIGGAFGAIVTSLVDDIIGPILGVIMGGVDFTTVGITVGGATIAIGNFIQAIINFLIVALVIFSVIKAFNAAREMRKASRKKRLRPRRSARTASPRSISTLHAARTAHLKMYKFGITSRNIERSRFICNKPAFPVL